MRLIFAISPPNATWQGHGMLQRQPYTLGLDGRTYCITRNLAELKIQTQYPPFQKCFRVLPHLCKIYVIKKFLWEATQ